MVYRIDLKNYLVILLYGFLMVFAIGALASDSL